MVAAVHLFHSIPLYHWLKIDGYHIMFICYKIYISCQQVFIRLPRLVCLRHELT